MELVCRETVVRDGFEWNRQKNESNYADHGVWFEDVLAVFRDPNGFYEEQVVGGELRNLLIARQHGRRNRKMYVVVFAVRGSRTRIISAREPEPGERDEYE